MMRLLSAELLKLRTARSLPVPLYASLAMVAFVTYQMLDGAGIDGAAALGTVEHTRKLLSVSGMVGVVMLLFGVLAATADMRHRSVIGDVLAAPSRWPVVAAKASAVLIVSAGWTLLTAAAQLALAVPFLRAQSLGLSEVLTAEVLPAAAAGLALGPLMAVLGVGLGTVLRNQSAAVAGGVLWFAFLEHELSAALPALGKWLPATAGLAMGGVSHGADLTMGAGTARLAVWAVALLAAGALLTVRRDV